MNRWKLVKPDFSCTNHVFSVNLPFGSMHEWPFYGAGVISQLIQCGQRARITYVTHTVCFTCQNQRSPEVLTSANEFIKNGALLLECQSIWLLHWSAHTQDTVCLCSQPDLLFTQSSRGLADSRNVVHYVTQHTVCSLQRLVLVWVNLQMLCENSAIL